MIRPLYQTIVGTGGLGVGTVFKSQDMHTLGRNESRLAELTESRDYCKLHIVFHYLAKMLTPHVRVVGVSKVGKDEYGAHCLTMMEGAGVETDFIATSKSSPTMRSMCLLYPDNSGCNVTSSNSACNEVTPEYIEQCMKALGDAGNMVIVALPEVPFASRKAMLELGKQCGAFCAATVPTADAKRFLTEDCMALCDLLAINIDEASALCGVNAFDSMDDARLCAEMLTTQYPWMKLWITLGKMGSVTASDGEIYWQEALPVSVIASTAGAGDAGLAGILIGLALGLPFHKQHQDAFWCETPLASAVELGIMFSGISIESPDSIVEGFDWETLGQYISCKGLHMEKRFQNMMASYLNRMDMRL